MESLILVSANSRAVMLSVASSGGLVLFAALAVDPLHISRLAKSRQGVFRQTVGAFPLPDCRSHIRSEGRLETLFGVHELTFLLVASQAPVVHKCSLAYNSWAVTAVWIISSILPFKLWLWSIM